MPKKPPRKDGQAIDRAKMLKALVLYFAQYIPAEKKVPVGWLGYCAQSAQVAYQDIQRWAKGFDNAQAAFAHWKNRGRGRKTLLPHETEKALAWLVVKQWARNMCITVTLLCLLATDAGRELEPPIVWQARSRPRSPALGPGLGLGAPARANNSGLGPRAQPRKRVASRGPAWAGSASRGVSIQIQDTNGPGMGPGITPVRREARPGAYGAGPGCPRSTENKMTSAPRLGPPLQNSTGCANPEWAYAFCKRWKLNPSRKLTEKGGARSTQETVAGVLPGPAAPNRPAGRPNGIKLYTNSARQPYQTPGSRLAPSHR